MVSRSEIKMYKDVSMFLNFYFLVDILGVLDALGEPEVLGVHGVPQYLK